MANRKFDSQRGEVRRINGPALLPDEVECPVCSHPAVRSDCPDKIHYRYRHAFRLFSCISVEKAPTLEEEFHVRSNRTDG